MASISASCLKFNPCVSHSRAIQVAQVTSLKLVTANWGKNGFFSSNGSRRLIVSCAAKAETVEKVCEIVKKQLALPAETELTPDSKFSALGADSLDTVEIVMGLEEEFDISVEEESSQNITTVQEAADLIEKLVQKKAETPAASA